MGDRRIIFLDIDGTLVEPGRNVPPQSAREAIDAAREKGHLVFLCTGRNLGMLKPVFESGTYDGLIGSSGGYVRIGDEVIYNCPMTEDQRTRVMDAFSGEGIYRTIECLGGSFTDEGFKDYLMEHSDEGANSELLRWRRQVESSLNIRPMAEYRGEPAYKMVLMAWDADRMIRAARAVEQDFNLVLQGSLGDIANAEVINRAFDKGTAVRRVAEYYGMPVEATVGFGDSMNDLEMMQTCGLSICMGNGNEQLKAESDEVCGSVTEDGLARAFEAHGWV